MEYFGREKELQFLSEVKGRNLIKVITGIRRVGKSTLLEMFKKRLVESGVDKRLIHSFNFEDRRDFLSDDWRENYDNVCKNVVAGETNYMFIDEPQSVADFEKLLDSLFVNPDIDLFVTGSNAYFLSTQLATLLTGRYIEIHLLPFSFFEYNLANKNKKAFRNYLNSSAFPEIADEETGTPLYNAYLKNIYQSVVEKDLTTKYQIKEKLQFNNLVKYLFKHIGSEISINNIANFLKQNNDSITNKTIDRYVTALKECFLLYECPRYDVKRKKQLATLAKFYVVDLGLRNEILGVKTDTDIGHQIENVVYFELIRRGYNVFVGKNYNSEIDFIALKNGEIEYYQVTYLLADEKIISREFDVLASIKDNYKKYVLSMDELDFSRNGIKHMNISEWLLKSRQLQKL